MKTALQYLLENTIELPIKTSDLESIYPNFKFYNSITRLKRVQECPEELIGRIIGNLTSFNRNRIINNLKDSGGIDFENGRLNNRQLTELIYNNDTGITKIFNDAYHTSISGSFYEKIYNITLSWLDNIDPNYSIISDQLIVHVDQDILDDYKSGKINLKHILKYVLNIQDMTTIDMTIDINKFKDEVLKRLNRSELYNNKNN